MKRKILGLTLVLCIMTTLLTALPLTVNAASSGKCGTNVNWTLDDNGTLTISGTGSMTIYPSYSSVPWYNSRSSIKTVVIQGGVTSIGIEAFYNCNSLTSITIPDSVTSIGYCAFYGCTGLTSITIPDSVTSIGNYAFQNCSRLTLITISNSVTSIGNYAFLNCSSIASITIPDCVTSIGSGVFSGCYSLKEVYYIGSKEDWSKISISSGNTYLTNATLHYIIANGSCGEKVTWALDDNGALFIIGTGDMANYTSTSNAPWYGYASDIEKVVIRNGVTGIGKYAFFKCSKVTSITIPGSIKSIGYAAFYNCTNLTSITIPASVTSIDGYAFWNCSNIKHVYYIGNEENWNKISIDSSNIPLTNATRHYIIANGSCGNNVNWALDYEGTLTISGTGDMTNYDYMSSPWLSSRSSVKTVVIQDGVTSIGNYAFYYCNNLTS
ncbi:MAG: leucine-rich repeat domain-containing protein, partial [Clostridia bacterium]|nr:leucine-rich repeat domain-containing protein [Clostridia bacterium]